MRVLLSHTGRAGRRVLRAVLALLSVVAVAVVIAGGVGMYLVVNLEDYRDEVAATLSDLVKRPVSIGAVAVGFDGAIPLLKVTDLDILDDSGAALAGFRRAELRIDVVASLQDMALRPEVVRIVGAALGVRRDRSGSVRILGLADATGARSDMTPARRLLVGPDRVEFTDARLVIEDPRLGDQPIELGLRVGLSRAGSAQLLTGEIVLPGDRTQSIAVNGQLGVATAGDSWIADLTIAGEGLRLARLGKLMPGSRLPGANPRADVNLRMRFTDGELTRADGRIALSALELYPGDPLPGPTTLAGDLSYRPVADGWQLEVRNLDVGGARGAWTAERARLRYYVGGDAQPGRYTVNLSDARVEDALALVGYLEPDMEDVSKLRGFRATGAATDLSAAWTDVRDGPAPFAAAFAFTDLAWPERPGVNWGIGGLSGFVSLSPEGGVINLSASRDVRIDAAEVSATPLRFDSIAGAIDVMRGDGAGGDGAGASGTQREGAGVEGAGVEGAGVEGAGVEGARGAGALLLRARALSLRGERLNVDVQGAMRVAGDDPVQVDGTIDIARLDAATMRSLLPSPLFAAGMNQWLGESIVSGNVRSLRIRLEGSVEALQAAPDDTSVRVEGQLDNLRIRYAPNWPELYAVSGPLLLERGALTMNAEKARLSDSAVAVTANVGNVSDERPALTLDIRSSGTVADLIAALRRSPLAAQLPPALKDLRARGNARVDSRIVLSGGAELESATSAIRLGKVDLTLNDTLPTIRGLTGTLQIDGRTLAAKDLSGAWLGQAITLDLQAQAQGSGELRIRSRVSPATLRRLARLGEIAEPDWLRNIDGSSSWTVVLGARPDGMLTFDAETKLAGTRIDLPPPLGKSARSARQLQLSGTVDDASAVVAARYGPIHGRTLIPLASPGTVGYQVRFNAQAPEPRPNVRRIAGTLSLLDLDAWSAFLDPDSETARTAMPSVDVKLDSLRFAGISFPNTRVQVAEPDPGKPVRVLLEGPKLAGRVEPPNGDTALRIDLDRLIVPERGPHDDERTDPRKVPAFTFLAKQLVYGETDLGTLKISASRQPAGLLFDTIYLISPLFDLQGSGQWRAADNAQRTDFDVEVHADALGNLMRAAGVAGGAAEGGATRLNASVGWAGTPGDVSVAGLGGRVDMHIGAGRLPKVDAGTGARVFGLLNMRSLPQILALDFSGFLDKGLEFKRIAGSFTLEAGQAYTNDLTLDAKTTTIDVAGRTGLIDEDYDQIVTVRPKLSDSLPVAGAAFGGVGAGVGAALWLAEKLLNTKLMDEVASFRYTVTGPWARPQIVRVKETEAPVNER